jgi:hypothetical protein
VRKLLQYCSIDDVPKLRASYMAAKVDPGVFVGDDGTITPVARVNEASRNADLFKWASWKPAVMVTEYVQDKTNRENQKAFFLHITNFVARNHWDKTETSLEPSPYLNVEISNDQRCMLRPTMADVTHGSIMADTVGARLKKSLQSDVSNLLRGISQAIRGC